jgi:hypothetical protein
MILICQAKTFWNESVPSRVEASAAHNTHAFGIDTRRVYIPGIDEPDGVTAKRWRAS